MATCPNGHANPDHQQYCGECGATLPVTGQFCENGHENPDHHQYCNVCGVAIAPPTSQPAGTDRREGATRWLWPAAAGVAIVATAALIAVWLTHDFDQSTNRQSSPTPYSSQPAIMPAGPSVAPGGLATGPDGQVAVETKSGQTSCLIGPNSVECETQGTQWPLSPDGTPYQRVKITPDGRVQWLAGHMADIPRTRLDYETYRVAGWKILATENGTEFTNDRTGGGALVSTQLVQSVDAAAGSIPGTAGPTPPVPAPAAPMPPVDNPANDSNFLAALHHGGICCSSQRDSPIWQGSPDQAISLGRKLASEMTANPTYPQFQSLRAEVANAAGVDMNGFETGEMIVLAIHYYAPHSVEKTFINDALGGDAGEAGYWYGPEARALGK
jgi:hypothetical protein